MRRSDREVNDIKQLQKILNECKVCHVAMVDEGYPYVIPLNYAYELEENTLTLYFHCAKEGRKINILHQNNNVCFEMCIEGAPVNAHINPCNSGYYFSSILGFGKVEFISETSEKKRILSLLLKHQANLDVTFNEAQASSVCIFKIATQDFTGKIKVNPNNK